MIGQIECTCKGVDDAHESWDNGNCKNSITTGMFRDEYFITVWPRSSTGNVAPQYSYVSREDALRLAHDLMNYVASTPKPKESITNE